MEEKFFELVEKHLNNEIAETLGIAKGTVMSRLFYARKRLAENMKGSL